MAAPQPAQLALALSPQPAPTTVADEAPRRLWLSVYLPHLPLEIVARDGVFQTITAEPPALAITEEVKGRPCIHSVSRAAGEAGVVSGLSLAAALALCPGLILRPRQPAVEQRTLEELAQWAYQFTPQISLDFPQSLLLEVKNSLRLFGGLSALTERIQAALEQQGFHPCLAVTPSPRASWLLARARVSVQITGIDALRSTLGQLPLSALDLPPSTLQRLNKTGLTRLRDLWRLPRPDLGRRYGLELLNTLDQIGASQPQLLTHFEQPVTFSAEQDLPIAMESWLRFWPAIEQLLQRLIEFLRDRNAAISAFELSFFHARQACSQLSVGLRTPSQSIEHLSELLRERLNQFALPASVIAVKLSSDAIQPYRAENRSLLAPERQQRPNDGDQEWQHLLDQLQARLGADSVHTLCTVDDHRPECSQDYDSLHWIDDAVLPASQRPCWLLPRPQPLKASDYRIQGQGERIESGWWDQQSVRRDYHIAVDCYGSRYWVYRELGQSDNWYLHGVFG